MLDIISATCLIILSFFACSDAVGSLTVTLPHGGSLIGTNNLTSFTGRKINSFLGIQYAEAPINNLRFKEPVPFGSWKGVRNATQLGDICPQHNFFLYNGPVIGNEDCLYLNVYVPEKPKTDEPLPVLIWLYGGAFEFGSSDLYEPTYILDYDVILVTVNFRNGPLGFLSTETLDCPGNFQFKDQLESMKWVQKNIASFGGNPNKVTLFGESSGAANVHHHMASEQSKGLFHRAIIASGSYENNWAAPLPKGVAADRTRRLANNFGCDGSNSDWTKILDCLRTLTAENITRGITLFHKWQQDPIIPFTAVIEPAHNTAFITQIPSKIKNPHGNSIPLITGYVRDEGLFRSPGYVLQDEILTELKENFDQYLPYILKYDLKSSCRQKSITKQLKNFYFKNGPVFNSTSFENFTEVISDALFTTGVDEIIRKRILSKNSAPTYPYFFQQVGPKSLVELIFNTSITSGVSHFDDLQYFFPLETVFPNPTQTPENTQFRTKLLDLWMSFVINGVPSSQDSEIPQWPAATIYPPQYLIVGNPDRLFKKPWFKLDKVNIQPRLDFWHKLDATK